MSTSSARFGGILIVSVVMSATPIVAVRPGSAPMITPTSEDSMMMPIDVGVLKFASDCPNRKSPSNIGERRVRGQCAQGSRT